MKQFLDGKVTLYLGDCRSVLPDLKPSPRLVLTDPPYESHMHAAKRKKKVFGAQKRIRTDGHANPPPVDFAAIDDDTRTFLATFCQEHCEGWSAIFCTPEGVAAWRDALEAAGAKYKRACVWSKPDSAPQFNGQGPAMGAEMFTTAWHGQGHSNWNGGGSRNVFTYPCQPSDRDGLHPTEKPVQLMVKLVELFSDEGDLVLDPFMGTGATGVACVKRGRRFIGIERDEKYFNRACERIESTVAQPDFFVAKPADYVQERLIA